MIREMKATDVSDVVRVHLASFPNFFLSFLGSSFLNLYYAGLCSHPKGLCYVMCNPKNEIVGFVAGVSDPRGFYSFLLKQKWAHFAVASVGAVFKKPSIILRLARAFLYPGKNPVGDHVAGLFSIGVLPQEQGQRYGNKLVLEFLNLAKARGCNEVFLTTDKNNNEKTNHFYQSLGFYIKRSYITPENRAMNEYWISL